MLGNHRFRRLGQIFGRLPPAGLPVCFLSQRAQGATRDTKKRRRRGRAVRVRPALAPHLSCKIRVFAVPQLPRTLLTTVRGKRWTAKTQQRARTASGSIGRSAASPLTATAALRFAPCRLLGKSILHPAGAFCSPFSFLRSPGRQRHPFGAIAWKSLGRRDQRERWSLPGFHARPSLRFIFFSGASIIFKKRERK